MFVHLEFVSSARHDRTHSVATVKAYTHLLLNCSLYVEIATFQHHLCTYTPDTSQEHFDWADLCQGCNSCRILASGTRMRKRQKFYLKILRDRDPDKHRNRTVCCQLRIPAQKNFVKICRQVFESSEKKMPN